MMKRGLICALTAGFLVTAAPAQAGRSVEVVLTLRQPSLATAAKRDRTLAAATTTRARLDVRSPASVSYTQSLERAQDAVAARIERTIPGAHVRWHYTVTLNALAVVVPQGNVRALRRFGTVWPTATYAAALDRSPQLIGAPALWGPALATAGQGMKIGIVDEGVDQTHPFLNPAGYTMPPSFPKGNAAYTTAKVIAAWAFPPPTPTWKYAGTPFDPENSEHGTHVAGIAAGNNGTRATGCNVCGGTPTLSGVAPRAYIGNYKALTIPTPDAGLDGNAPEIARAIEQAVRDGMDVINLSIGEPEIEPSRDVVVAALEGAYAAGVVPVVAAGNDFGEFGRGSVSSPGDTPDAITVAASTTDRGSAPDIIAGFSSSGPTPVSLKLKPDVTAPGVNILSSVPARIGTWAIFNGTSMATPHVSGAVALLRQQHPTWTPAQVKSALEQTGATVYGGVSRTTETSPLREGGGRIDLPKANAPLLFASPQNISFGILRPGSSADAHVTLNDAGGGAGTWTVTINGNAVSTPAVATVPGDLVVHAAIPAGTPDGVSAGFVVLQRGTDVRRIPFWLFVETPRLGSPTATIAKTATYKGNAAKGKANVDSYRFPEPPGVKLLSGPEQVFAVRVTSAIANVGARVVSLGRGVAVAPRFVRDGDENRLTGYVGLPVDLNPYRSLFGGAAPVVGAIYPTPGTYDLVFDTEAPTQAGPFTFRVWFNDVAPPTVRIKGYRNGVVTLALVDKGSGVDPTTIVASVDGRPSQRTFKNGVLALRTGTLKRGTHRVSVTVSDYQESKNMEDVARILPNTRFFSGRLKLR